jgi:hypothetical protein
MTDLEVFLSILNGVLLFVWYREHDKRTDAQFYVKMLRMMIGRIGMGHATVVKTGDGSFNVKPTEAGIKAAYEEITLP